MDDESRNKITFQQKFSKGLNFLTNEKSKEKTPGQEADQQAPGIGKVTRYPANAFFDLRHQDFPAR